MGGVGGAGRMARPLARGDVRLVAFEPPDEERPVVILTRDPVIPFLNTVMVVPVTSTIHGLPSEVLLGEEAGLRHPSAATLDHVQTVAKRRIGRYLGRLSPEQLSALCRALAFATGCDG